MPGANCSVYGCGTSRYTKDIGIFQIPCSKKGDKNQEKWRADFLAAITRSRVADQHFKQMVEENKIYACEKHFKADEIKICKYCNFKKNQIYCLRLTRFPIQTFEMLYYFHAI